MPEPPPVFELTKPPSPAKIGWYSLDSHWKRARPVVRWEGEMTFALPTVPDLEVRDLLERDGPQAVALQLLTLHPVEITEALESLGRDGRLSVVRALPVNVVAQVLLNADAEF